MTKKSSDIEVLIQRLAHYPKDMALPEYQSVSASGVDLRAAISAPVTLKPSERTLIATGIAVAIPEGYEAQIRPRSGLALKKGLTLLNTPGTIDADYRGEIKVIVVNLGNEPCLIEAGERIAQMIFAPVARAQWNEVENVTEAAKSIRGDGGFGHTGKN